MLNLFGILKECAECALLCSDFSNQTSQLLNLKLSVNCREIMATAAERPYYDIMIIGSAGMGKSTTANKLVIANPSGINYLGEQQKDPTFVNGKLKTSNLSAWLHSDQPDTPERSTNRLKNLISCRSTRDPHVQIGQGGGDKPSDATSACELLSNDSTFVRVLDVPGFFGKNDFSASGLFTVRECSSAESGISIMRNVMQIQSHIGLKFRRILYFLPVRDPLVRESDIVEKELEWVSHFFGDVIFQKMVIVTTVTTRFSRQTTVSDDQKFPTEDIEKTRDTFDTIMRRVFPESHCAVPPIIFLSLSETCESVLDKVQSARVLVDDDQGLSLQFRSSTCANCGIKYRIENGRRIAACYFGGDWSSAVPYNETSCHPIFVPKNSVIQRIINGIVYYATRKWRKGFTWEDYVYDEVCANCQEKPNLHGCIKVGSTYYGFGD